MGFRVSGHTSADGLTSSTTQVRPYRLTRAGAGVAMFDSPGMDVKDVATISWKDFRWFDDYARLLLEGRLRGNKASMPASRTGRAWTSTDASPFFACHALVMVLRVKPGLLNNLGHLRAACRNCARLAKRIAVKKNSRPIIAVTGRDVLEGLDKTKRNNAESIIQQEFSKEELVPQEDYFILDAQSRPIRYETVATVVELMRAALARAFDRQFDNQRRGR